MQKRELWQVIIFGLITLGIYDLVWLYKTRNEMVRRGANIPNFKLLLLPLIFFILMIILSALAGFAQWDVPGSLNTKALISALFLVLPFFSVIVWIPISLYWLYKYCNGVEKVTKGKMSLGLSYAAVLVLGCTGFGIVWPFLIQDAFNKTR
jgi:phosphoglycerol transferase MdoB-like AlkP superfamily enzyme